MRLRVGRAQNEELDQLKKKREETGVSLYQVQQALAKLQMSLEKVHENQPIISQAGAGSLK